MAAETKNEASSPLSGDVKTLHRFWTLLLSFVIFLSPSMQAAPATVTLNGEAVAIDSIRWSWTVAGAGTTFTLLDANGGTIATFSGTTDSFTESSLPPDTAVQRKLQQSDAQGTTVSSLVTVATPNASATVPFGSAGTAVGSDQLSRATIPLNALPGPGQISLSLDPVNKPLTARSIALIAQANAALPVGRVAIPASVREVVVQANGSSYTGPLAAAGGIQIPYSDVNSTGYVDGVTPAIPVVTLALFTIDPASGRWTLVSNASIDATNKVVVANVSHFSIFGLLGASSTIDLRSLRVFPTPWKPGSGGKFDDAQGIHFSSLTPAASIKIFTITGQIVRSIDKQVTDGNEVVWDGKNSDGEQVANGVYFYLVTDPATGEQEKNRIAILR